MLSVVRSALASCPDLQSPRDIARTFSCFLCFYDVFMVLLASLVVLTLFLCSPRLLLIFRSVELKLGRAFERHGMEVIVEKIDTATCHEGL